MSAYVTFFTARVPHAIKAQVGNAGELTIDIKDGDVASLPSHVTIHTGSLALSDALAEAINGVMARFAKPAPAEAAKEAAE